MQKLTKIKPLGQTFHVRQGLAGRGLSRGPVSWYLSVIVLALGVQGAFADEASETLRYLDETRADYAQMAQTIWNHAELGYLENKSSALLQEHLARHGFKVEAAVAGLPTAFVATFGEGHPVIGILAEFDALPGISQAATPVREVVEGKPDGHACGHHLFGTGSVAAAVAVKRWMSANKVQGTLKLFGTPAEEGGSGKVYMVREGLFDDVDAALHWHPGDRNAANPSTSLANKSAKFRFAGVSSHAAAAPDRGRSALDGVEAMDFMANLLREHVPEETRIHYVITHGGSAPNVVPDFAEVYYYVRHPDAAQLLGIWDRIVKAGEAAALGTGTKFSMEVIHGNHSLLPNEVLAGAMHASLTKVGGVSYSVAEQAFAETIGVTLNGVEEVAGFESKIQPLKLQGGKGSTDVGDVSWSVPTTGLNTATWVPGTSAHSWQAIASGGTSIGHKGMLVASKTLALTAQQLFRDPETLRRARAEFDDRRGPGFKYESLLGERSPPLDYRL